MSAADLYTHNELPNLEDKLYWIFNEFKTYPKAICKTSLRFCFENSLNIHSLSCKLNYDSPNRTSHFILKLSSHFSEQYLLG